MNGIFIFILFGFCCLSCGAAAEVRIINMLMSCLMRRENKIIEISISHYLLYFLLVPCQWHSIQCQL